MTMVNKSKIEQVQELWRKGMLQKDICKELGLCHSTVSSYIQKAPDYVKPEPKTEKPRPLDAGSARGSRMEMGGCNQSDQAGIWNGSASSAGARSQR